MLWLPLNNQRPGLETWKNQTVQAHHSECAFLLPFVYGGLLQAASAGRFPFVPVSKLLQPTATTLESPVSGLSY